MSKILLVMLALCFVGEIYCSVPEAASENETDPEKEFWPPDLIPHPHPPGYPQLPKKPELA